MGRMIFMALNVSDLEASSKFYKAAFDIDLHADKNEPETDTWIGGDHTAFSWTDGAFLHFALFPASPPERPVSRDAQLGLTATNIEEAHAKAVAAGAPVVHAPRPEPWGTTSRYRDPDGNLISLTQR